MHCVGKRPDIAEHHRGHADKMAAGDGYCRAAARRAGRRGYGGDVGRKSRCGQAQRDVRSAGAVRHREQRRQSEDEHWQASCTTIQGGHEGKASPVNECSGNEACPSGDVAKQHHIRQRGRAFLPAPRRTMTIAPSIRMAWARCGHAAVVATDSLHPDRQGVTTTRRRRWCGGRRHRLATQPSGIRGGDDRTLGWWAIRDQREGKGRSGGRLHRGRRNAGEHSVGFSIQPEQSRPGIARPGRSHTTGTVAAQSARGAPSQR